MSENEIPRKPNEVWQVYCQECGTFDMDPMPEDVARGVARRHNEFNQQKHGAKMVLDPSAPRAPNDTTCEISGGENGNG